MGDFKIQGHHILIAVLAAIYLLFLSWYDGWLQTPMSDAEANAFIDRLPADEGNEELRDRMRRFATEDDGNEFFMLNLNTYKSLDDQGSNKDYEAYSDAVILMLLSRASHPIYASSGLQSLVSPRYGEPWQQVILVRYRSRRDFVSMISSDAYQKVVATRAAGIRYAEVFPTAPGLNLTSPRLYAALILGAIGLFLHVCLKGRPHYERY
jgi:hypothetical protein